MRWCGSTASEAAVMAMNGANRAPSDTPELGGGMIYEV
jgi:hypothetical protein